MQSYWEDLPEPLVEALLVIVDLLQKQSTTSAAYSVFRDLDAADQRYIIRARRESVDRTGPGDPIFSLEVLGLLRRDTEGGQHWISLTPQALEFARYKRRSRFGRWWERTVLPNAPGWAAFFSGAILLLLALLQIYDIGKAHQLFP